MSPREQIESKQAAISQLCTKLGIPSLRVHFEGPDQWSSVVFVADFDASRLEGYADRYFGLAEGLLRIFHRRVHVIEAQMFAPSRLWTITLQPEIELLRAS